MPTYDYRCEHNGRMVEVRHSMQDKLTSWGQVCKLAGVSSGDTPENAVVTRMITSVNVMRHEAPITLDSILPK